MTKTCVNCGEVVKKTDIFCPFCGASTDKRDSSAATQESSYTEHNIVYCSQCNAKNKIGAQFCEFCGNEITSDSFKTSVGTEEIHGTERAHATHTYGSYSTEPSDSSRKWYQPPKRTRSAKHPAEWFFWTGWGIYFLIRVIFQILWFILRIVIRSKGRRF